MTAEFSAPGDWRAIDFISDLHLAADTPRTFGTWADHMRHTDADAVFILGDLFEAWVGDDMRHAPFEAACVDVLREASRQRQVGFMAGNRDFLVGEALARGCGITLLADPTVFVFGGVRWLLSHGDLLCLSDLAYQRYRAQVHAPEWIAHFLRKPLAERHAMARQMRDASRAHQNSLLAHVDLDAEASRAWLRAANASTLLHGHTHRPGEHALGNGMRRLVLSDWDLQAAPPRAQRLRVHSDGSVSRTDLA
jgi:UDP-2,3-diacylglucosamine hydrolase